MMEDDEISFVPSDEDIKESIDESPVNGQQLLTPTEESFRTEGRNVKSAPVFPLPYTPPAITDQYKVCTEVDERRSFRKREEHVLVLNSLKHIRQEYLSIRIVPELVPHLKRAPYFVKVVVSHLSVSMNEPRLVDEQSATDIGEILSVYISKFGVDGLYEKWIEDISTEKECNLMELFFVKLACLLQNPKLGAE